MTITQLARANILKLKPYQSARKLGGNGKIWLNANEYPISSKYSLKIHKLNRYPPVQPKNLINKYAKYARVSPEQILVSRGADEAIELLIKAFCNPHKDTILLCPPTYGMYNICAQILGIRCKIVPSTSSWQLDLQQIALKLKNVKLIYLCHPNNPTGNTINHKDIKKLLKLINNHALLIIDEAYIDFCINNTLTGWLSKFTNLVILRTLSKAFALAGIRCGFTIANPDIIKLLLKIIPPYPLSIPTIKIAELALSNKNIKKVKNNMNINQTNRNYLATSLITCRCVKKVFPSKSNFLLIQVYQKYQVFKNLWNKGIILRDQSYQRGLSNCIRITIGTYTECKQVIKSLKKINC